MNNYNPQNDPVINAWKPIADANLKEWDEYLFFRPLAVNSADPTIAVKQARSGNGHCWPSTVPDGEAPINPTSGSCHVSHYQELTTPNDPPNPLRLKEWAVLQAVAKMVKSAKQAKKEDSTVDECLEWTSYLKDLGVGMRELLADPTYASFLAGLEPKDV